MALQFVERALNVINPQVAAPIYALLAKSLPELLSQPSHEQLKSIALELSEVSGGVGLDILGLFMHSDEGGISPGIESAISRVALSLANLQPPTNAAPPEHVVRMPDLIQFQVKPN